MKLSRLLKVTPRTDYGSDQSSAGPLRRLTLRDADGRPFLERWALDLGIAGVYLHHVTGPDPGLDLHDHPWAFVSLVLSGAYVDESCDVRAASAVAGEAAEQDNADRWSGFTTSPNRRGARRVWRAGTVHRVTRLTAHRIVSCTPGTWTVIVRGRARQPWGFYTPAGWIDADDYDYAARRPGSEQRNGITRRAAPVEHEVAVVDLDGHDPVVVWHADGSREIVARRDLAVDDVVDEPWSEAWGRIVADEPDDPTTDAGHYR